MLQNRVVCIVGPKGTGKTERASRLYGLQDRALVFNVAFDKAYDVRSTHVVEDDFISAGKVMRDNDKYRISFTSENLERTKSGGLTYTDLDPLIRECYLHGPMTVFLDESHMLCASHSCSDEVLRSIYIGRHHQLSSVFIMQRANGVHPVIRTNADEYHFFALSEPLDLKFISQKCGEDVAYTVANLKRLQVVGGKVVPGQCFVWTVEGNNRIE